MKKITENWNKILHKKLWIDSMIGMTWGFIASLVVGTIVGLFGINQSNNFSEVINTVKKVLTYMTPFAIGVGVGYKTKMKPLQILAIMIAAGLAAHSTLVPKYVSGINWHAEYGISVKLFLPGDVFGAWITSMVLVYFFSVVKWEYMLDIILLPFIGVLFGLLLSGSLIYVTTTITILIEYVIDHTINKSHWAGILLAPVVGILMGAALSLPTSSAAIAFALHLQGDAATAAMAATAAQMLAWGVLTYKSTNSWSKTMAVAFGTSMLQMPNFAKKPKLMILPLLVSGICALIATAATPLEFEAPSVTSGMGSCALYGQIMTLNENGWTNYIAWLNVVVMQLALPVALTVLLSQGFFKMNWIQRKEMII